jgi:hypothetical protein
MQVKKKQPHHYALFSCSFIRNSYTTWGHIPDPNTCNQNWISRLLERDKHGPSRLVHMTACNPVIRVSRVNSCDKDCLPEHANACVSSILKDSGHIKGCTQSVKVTAKPVQRYGSLCFAKIYQSCAVHTQSVLNSS